jgi:PiT family inorganic phosphate transporter
VDLLLVTVIGIVALALLFDFSNGFHDAANSVATVVATRALPPKGAVWFSAAFNFAAYFFVGTAVANTVAKTVSSGYESIAVVFSALVAAIAWNYFTWWVGMPSSSSHAIIGGLIGAGLSAGGLDAVNWSSVEKTAIAIIASPAVAFTISFLAMFLVAALQWTTGWHDNAKPFKALQLVSAGAVSFGHGANDAQKTMGLIAALLVGAGYLDPHAGSKAVDVPEWVALSAYTAIALGTVWGGWKIIETMGLRITLLHASSGVAANVGATAAIFGATAVGVPVSTTHAAASSVIGAGVSSGRGANWRVVAEMVVAWVTTIPATMALSFLVYRLTQLPTAAAWIAVGSVLFVLGGAITYAMWHAVKADDVAAEIPQEQALEEHQPVHPHLEGHGAID